MKKADPTAAQKPKEQLTAWEKWELPLLDAQGNQVEEVEEVKPLTAADLEEIRSAAREDGFQEGREAGYTEGFEAGRADGHKEGFAAGKQEGHAHGEQQARELAQAELASRLDRLEHILGELLLPIERHEEELETVMVNLVTVLARAVVYRELGTDSSQIRQVVRRAIAALPSTANNLRIHIHPDDIEPVREVAERLESGASIIEDDTLMPGGCKVESNHSLVDFTVEKRFQHAVQGMLEEQLAEPAGADNLSQTPHLGELTDFHRDVLSNSAMSGADVAATSQQDNPPGESDDITPG